MEVLKQLERGGSDMTKRAIKIELTDSGDISLKNDNDKVITVTLSQKQLDTKDVYELLEYESGLNYSLDGEAPYSEEQVSGPKNEKFRLYNYVYEYMSGLISKIGEFEKEQSE